MRFWTIVWTVWAVNLAALIVFFLIFETLALLGKARGDTLSEQVWYLRNANDNLYWLIIDVVYVAAITFVWLIFHFRFQGPPANV